MHRYQKLPQNSHKYGSYWLIQKLFFCLLKVLLLHNFFKLARFCSFLYQNSWHVILILKAKKILFQLIVPIFFSFSSMRSPNHHSKGHMLIFWLFADSQPSFKSRCMFIQDVIKLGQHIWRSPLQRRIDKPWSSRFRIFHRLSLRNLVFLHV